MDHILSRKRAQEDDSKSAEGESQTPDVQTGTNGDPEPLHNKRGLDTTCPNKRMQVGSAAAINRSCQGQSTVSRQQIAKSPPSDHVEYESGDNAESLADRYPITVQQREAQQLQRLESEYGTEQIYQWADEGIPVKSMGKPRDMEAYRNSDAEQGGETAAGIVNLPIQTQVQPVDPQKNGETQEIEVSQPDDPAEKEARDVAQTVMQMDRPPVQMNGQTRSTSAEQTAPAAKSLQRSLSSLYRTAAEDEAQGAPAPVQNAVQENGKPLEDDVRSDFESRFGTDFSEVRVHTGATADAAANAINAEAFTTGNDIFFANGAYDPDSNSGKELLAHELTHVVQQNDDGATGSIQRATAEGVESEFTGGYTPAEELDADGSESMFTAGYTPIEEPETEEDATTFAAGYTPAKDDDGEDGGSNASPEISEAEADTSDGEDHLPEGEFHEANINGKQQFVSGGETHVVQTGENLSVIADQYGISGGWQALYEFNKSVIGDDPNLIHVDQELLIPETGWQSVSLQTPVEQPAESSETGDESGSGPRMSLPEDGPVCAATERSGGGESAGQPIIDDEGNQKELLPDAYDNTKRNWTQEIDRVRGHVTTLENRYRSYRDQKLSEGGASDEISLRGGIHFMVGETIEAVGGADLPDERRFNDILVVLRAAKEALYAEPMNLQQADRHFSNAATEIDTLATEWREFMGDVQAGGERAVAALEMVEEMSITVVGGIAKAKFGKLGGIVVEQGYDGVTDLGKLGAGELDAESFGDQIFETLTDIVYNLLFEVLDTKKLEQICGTAVGKLPVPDDFAENVGKALAKTFTGSLKDLLNQLNEDYLQTKKAALKQLAKGEPDVSKLWEEFIDMAAESLNDVVTGLFSVETLIDIVAETLTNYESFGIDFEELDADNFELDDVDSPASVSTDDPHIEMLTKMIVDTLTAPSLLEEKLEFPW